MVIGSRNTVIQNRSRFFVVAGLSLGLLAGCGDPLRDVDRLSTVDLADTSAAPQLSVASEAAQPGTGGGFLSRLLGSAPNDLAQADFAAQASSDVVASLEAETASGVTDPVVAAPQSQSQPRRAGFLARLTGNAPSPKDVPVIAADAAVQEALGATPALSAQAAIDAPALQVAEPAPERSGFLNRLIGARSTETDQDTPVRTASLEPQISAESARPARSGSLFQRNSDTHKGPDAQIVAFGTRLPSGAVARVCDLPGGRLGKQVGQFPERGRGYKMFDSAPRATGPRPFYVTGFKDNCARTFTAALALFGSPTMHEQLRYGLPSDQQPYSLTDKAYEGIKVAICGVSRRKPCGSKVGLLEKDTAFISIYDRLGSNSTWSNILLHKGWVLAADRKS